MDNNNIIFLVFFLFIALLLIIILGVYSDCTIAPVYHTRKMISYFTPVNKLPEASEKEIHSIKPASIYVYIVATPEIYHYAELSIQLNKKYCEQYNFQFTTVNENLVPNLPINFTKIKKALNLMSNKKIKYIMHIDADAVIHNQDYDLRNILVKYFKKNPLTHFIAAEDCYDKTICSKPNKMNSGVYIVRNTTIGKQIMQTWLNSVQKGGNCEKYKSIFPNCQLVFEHCVRPKFFLNIQLVPYNILNGVDGLFINHFMQNLDSHRMSKMRQLRDNFASNTSKENFKRIPVY